MHIGLIGGIGPAAASYYYRKLGSAFAQAGIPLELTLAHTDLSLLVENLRAGNAKAQAREFTRLGKRLKAAGAEAIAITSIAAHFCARELGSITPLPIIDGIAAVHDAVARKRLPRVGLLGAAATMESHLFGALPPEALVLPDPLQRREVHDETLATATRGFATEESQHRLQTIGQALCDKGAEAVVLGGTDLFLAFDGNAGYPTISAADAHIDAIFRAAVD